jgi:hypothetical protein
MPTEMLRRFDYLMLDSTKRDFKCALNRLEEINVHQKSGKHYYGHTLSAHLQLFIVIFYVNSQSYSCRGYE